LTVLVQVRVLVEMGIAPHTRDERGRQAIHDAARSGHAETVRTLVWLKAPVEAQDDAGNTPLHLAAGYGKAATVQTLVRELKADVDSGNDQGERALHLAAATGQVCVRDTVALWNPSHRSRVNSGQGFNGGFGREAPIEC